MLKGKRSFLWGKGVGNYLICLGFSALIIILTSLIFSLIANSSSDPTKNLGIFSLATLLISAILGGFFTSKLGRGESIGYSLLVALSVVLIMLISCIILGKGKISGSAFMNYGCYLGVYAMASLLGKRGGRRRRHR